MFIALLAITAALLLPAWQDRRDVVAREGERLQAEALIFDESISRTLEATNRAIESLMSDMPSRAGRADGHEQIGQRLKAFSDAMPGVRSMFILDAHGNAMAVGAIDSVHFPNVKAWNVKGKTYFKTALSHPDPDTLYVSEPFVSDVGAWTFNLSRAVLTPQGQLDYLIVANMDLDDLRLLLQSARYKEDQFSTISHGTGREILIEPQERGKQGRTLAIPGTFFTAFMQTKQHAAFMRGTSSVAADGGERISAMRLIQPASLHMNYPLVVNVGRDIDAVLANSNQLIRTRSLLVLAIWCAAVLLTWQLQRYRAKNRKSSFEYVQKLQILNAALMDKEAALRDLADRDSLTELPNRRKFDEVLQLEWQHCAREKQSLSLLMIDADHFKRFNDFYGHLAGDECLKSIATRMQQCLSRPRDLLVRFGGEEFVALLPGTSAEGAAAVAEEVRLAVQALDITHGKSSVGAYVSVSIGVKTLIPTDAVSIATLLGDADKALYEAKAQGRNRVCVG